MRGELPVSRRRWVGAGLAVGVIIGAMGTAVLARRRHTLDQAVPEQTATVRERASTAVAGVRHRASAAVHGAASAVQGAAVAARDSVGRVREKAGNDAEDGPEPPATSESPSRPS